MAPLSDTRVAAHFANPERFHLGFHRDFFASRLDHRLYAKQKHLGCKKSARPIRSHNGYISEGSDTR